MRKILLVDDTPDCLTPLTRLLKLDGHTVECANDGREALGVLQRFTPDTIILDLMMPIMDGVSFLEAMRKNPQWKDIRVIVYTGYGEGSRAKQLASLGVTDVLMKASDDVNRLLNLVS